MCLSLYLRFYFRNQRDSIIDLSVNVLMFSDVSISYLTIKVCPVKYLLLRPEGASACCKIETKNNCVESIQVINIVSNRAKGWISKRVFQEKKAREISQKTNIPSLLIGTPTYQGVKKFFFFGKFSMLCFLETPVLRSALLLYYWRH